MNNTHSPMKASVLKNGIILALFALISTALVVVTDSLTKDKIISEKSKALSRILHQIVHPNQHDNDLNKDCIFVKNANLLGSKKAVKVFRARKNNRPVALMIQSVAPDGYNGNIELVVGIDQQQTIIGVRILSHNETPGLGDQIEHSKSHWLDVFKQHSLANTQINQWTVKKYAGVFDAMTGATITPRAVVSAVSNTLLYVKHHQNELFQSASNCSEKSK